METEKFYGRDIASKEEIKIEGTFNSYYEACRILEERGYTLGSMCMNSPIGFVSEDKFDYVAKWYNLSKSDIKKLDGVMLSNDFREGSVQIVTFK